VSAVGGKPKVLLAAHVQQRAVYEDLNVVFDIPCVTFVNVPTQLIHICVCHDKRRELKRDWTLQEVVHRRKRVIILFLAEKL